MPGPKGSPSKAPITKKRRIRLASSNALSVSWKSARLGLRIILTIVSHFHDSRFGVTLCLSGWGTVPSVRVVKFCIAFAQGAGAGTAGPAPLRRCHSGGAGFSAIHAARCTEVHGVGAAANPLALVIASA